MKLIYVDPQSDSNLGLYDYNLMKNLDCDIIYCCSNTYDSPYLDTVTYKKIFGYLQYKNILLKGLSYLWSIVSLWFVIYRIRPDILHIQWIRIWILDYFFLSTIRPYVGKIVFTAHNVVPHNSGDTMRAKYSKYYKRVDKLIVHTNITKEELINDFGVQKEKIEVIKHGILETLINEEKISKEIDRLRLEHNLSNKFVFSSLGFQSLYKGTDIIKDALNQSDILTNQEIFIFIAGRGDIINKKDFKNCENILVLDSFIKEETFQAILKLTDVLLFPYRRISQSGVLLTAIANHIPYIATNKGGLLEPLAEGKIAWELKEETSVALVKLMNDLLKNKNHVKQIKENYTLWNKIKLLYSWEKIGEQTTAWYKK